MLIKQSLVGLLALLLCFSLFSKQMEQFYASYFDEPVIVDVVQMEDASSIDIFEPAILTELDQPEINFFPVQYSIAAIIYAQPSPSVLLKPPLV